MARWTQSLTRAGWLNPGWSYPGTSRALETHSFVGTVAERFVLRAATAAKEKGPTFLCVNLIFLVIH